MSEYTTHTIETAPENSKPILTKVKSSYGFIPNLLGNMAESPAMLEGYITLSSIFDKTTLSETERQIILMTNNRLNGCTYCMAAHTWLARNGGVAEDVIEALRTGTSIADPKLEALRVFTQAVNESRGWPTNEQTAALIDAGYTQQTVLEVILGTSLKILSNYTNHVAGTQPDAVFAKDAWSPEIVSAA